MASTIHEVKTYLEQMAEELNDLASFDQMEMYRLVSDTGKNLPGLLEGEQTEENFVQGCVSNVYIAANSQNGRVLYRGSSEAMVIKGYVAILVHALSGLTPTDIIDATPELITHFAEHTNIRANLTPSRANAFGNIYELMVHHARRLS